MRWRNCGNLWTNKEKEEMTYLVAAYAVMWLITFIFVLSMAMRQRRLAAELEALKERLQETKRYGE
jgi:CcmD family protein